MALIVPTALFFGTILWHYFTSERARILASATEMVNATALDLETDIVARAQFISMLSLVDLRNLETVKDKIKLIESVSDSKVLISRANGELIFPAVVGKSPYDIIPKDGGTVINQSAGRKVTVAGLFKDPISGLASLAVNVLPTDNSDTRLTLIIPASSLGQAVKRTSIPPEWIYAVFDPGGAVLSENYSVTKDPAHRTFGDLLAKAYQLQRKAANALASDVDTAYMVFSPQRPGAWQVGVAIPYTILNAPLNQSLQISLWLGLALACIALPLAWLQGTRITRSARLMVAGTLDGSMSGTGGASFAAVREFSAVTSYISKVSADLRARTDDVASNQQRLGRIIDTVPGGIIEVSSDGIVVFANSMVHKLLKMPDENVVGRNFHDLISSIADMEGRPLDKDALPIMRALKGVSSNDFQQVLVTAAGVVVPMSVNASPVRDGRGQVTGALAVFSDISERAAADVARREMEGRLRTIFQSLPIGLVFAEAPSGRITSGNPEVERILRHPVLLSESKEQYGQWVSFHENGRQVAPEEYPLNKVLTGESDRAELECNYRRGDGTMLWIKVVAASLRDNSGKVNGAVVGILDIDDMKRAQAQQLLMNRELHHRVNNTLATVQGIANLTARSVKDIESFRRTFADRIISLSRTHTLLVQNSWNAIPLVDLVNLATESFVTPKSERFIITGEQAWLPSDIALALGMAIHELCTNAVKFGALSVDDGQIHLTWQVGDEDGRPVLQMEWVETGGPEVKQPHHAGFGSQLLYRILDKQLNGAVSVEYARQGVRVSILARL